MSNPSIKTDSILHFHEGIFGQEGYAIPHHGNEPGTLNNRIFRLTKLLGHNLFDMLHQRDVDLAVPPRISFLKDVHNLFVRASNLLEAWTVPHNESEMRPTHVTPAGHIFLVWPVPHYFIRNEMIREWSTLILFCISELMQHSENAKEMDIGPRVREVVMTYLHRVYSEMAIECFGKTRAEVNAAGFLLTAEDFANYNPDLFFTPTERTDTVPNLGRVMTEDMLAPLRGGLLVTALPSGLKPFPGTLDGYYDAFRADERQQQIEADALVASSVKSNEAPSTSGDGTVQSTSSAATATSSPLVRPLGS